MEIIYNKYQQNEKRISIEADKLTKKCKNMTIKEGD